VKADKVGFAGARETLKGFAHGLKHRQPVRPEVSRTFRHNFEVLASPWWVSRPLSMMVKDAARGRARRIGHPGRRDDWIAERARFYPERSGVLDFGGRS
jgi:hypothetical protein